MTETFSAPINGTVSASGVRIADDFRDNLIIDRYDPVFADMRASKRKHLRSVTSEDALTWNVFRSLRQIDARDWLPMLWRRAFPVRDEPRTEATVAHLWRSVEPPPGLREDGDEGGSEIDVVVETPFWVWFIEAKFRSDISTGTTTRPNRDQVLRNIDVGTYYAGVRPFWFSLLVQSPDRSRRGVAAVEQYSVEGAAAALLPHRRDGLSNLRGVSQVAWQDLADVLHHASANAIRQDERPFAARAFKWMCERSIASGAV